MKIRTIHGVKHALKIGKISKAEARALLEIFKQQKTMVLQKTIEV
jgi:hypothetical protein